MIIDLQRRLAEIGRIRIGQQVPAGNGKTRPEKLATFRLTSGDQPRIAQAAALYGGTPAQWQAPAGTQWEVVTTASALDVIVPPSDMAFSQWYELWSAGGCQRRCDGQQESIIDGPCLCDPDQRECDIHTRLSVMLRDLPGLGVWRVDTSGYYAAVELQGAVEVIRLAAGRGQMLPARLRLEQRMTKRPGQGTRRFAVPVLDIEVSPGQLIGGTVPIGELPAAQENGSAPAALTPVPASVPHPPVRSIADQAAAIGEPPAQPARRNAAQPIPATGLPPRTAAQAATNGEPIPAGDIPELPEEQEPDYDTPGTATPEQVKKLQVTYHTDLGFTKADRAQVVAATEMLLQRELTGPNRGHTHNNLSRNEAGWLIDVLGYPEPPGSWTGPWPPAPVVPADSAAAS